MLPNPDSTRQLEGLKRPAPQRPGALLDPLVSRRRLKKETVEDDRENLGIEDADPRWSKRELVLKRLEIPLPEVDPGGFAPDRGEFRGQPGDPFEVLVNRKERRRHRPRRLRSAQLLTGLAPLDGVLRGLGPGVTIVNGPDEPARSLLEQIAGHVARDFPVLLLSYHRTPRDLTLRVLSRIAGDRSIRDLARARELAEAFVPIRANLVLLEGSPDLPPGLLRARLNQVLSRNPSRRGLLAIDDLSRLACHDVPAYLMDLARMAEKLLIPILVALPGSPMPPEAMTWPKDLAWPRFWYLGDIASGGGAVDLVISKGPSRSTTKGHSEPKQCVLELTYQFEKGIFGPKTL